MDLVQCVIRGPPQIEQTPQIEEAGGTIEKVFGMIDLALGLMIFPLMTGTTTSLCSTLFHDRRFYTYTSETWTGWESNLRIGTWLFNSEVKMVLGFNTSLKAGQNKLL